MTRQNWQTALGQGETDSDWAVINGSQGKGGRGDGGQRISEKLLGTLEAVY